MKFLVGGPLSLFEVRGGSREPATRSVGVRIKLPSSCAINYGGHRLVREKSVSVRSPDNRHNGKRIRTIFYRRCVFDIIWRRIYCFGFNIEARFALCRTVLWYIFYHSMILSFDSAFVIIVVLYCEFTFEKSFCKRIWLNWRSEKSFPLFARGVERVFMTSREVMVQIYWKLAVLRNSVLLVKKITTSLQT